MSNSSDYKQLVFVSTRSESIQILKNHDHFSPAFFGTINTVLYWWGITKPAVPSMQPSKLQILHYLMELLYPTESHNSVMYKATCWHFIPIMDQPFCFIFLVIDTTIKASIYSSVLWLPSAFTTQNNLIDCRGRHFLTSFFICNAQGHREGVLRGSQNPCKIQGQLLCET